MDFVRQNYFSIDLSIVLHYFYGYENSVNRHHTSTMTLFSWLLGPSVLVYLVYTITAIILLLVPLYLYIQPKHVDASVPGPKRHWLWGTLFQFDHPPDDDDDDDNHKTSNKSKADKDTGGLNWDKWPEFCLNISRRFKFKTWGAPVSRESAVYGET
jgi:hypothetical protein